MPELPEVEVTRRGVEARLMGAKVRDVRLGKPLRWPLGVAPASLREAVVSEVTRRGKYIWLGLSGGEQGQGGVLMHLGMSGSVHVHDTEQPPGKHDHFDLVTDRGTLRLTDPRRFGAVVWSAGRDQDPARQLLARLGMEPFDPAWSGSVLHAGLAGRRQAIKPVLLGGDVVVGAGNIYACEALFRAGIDPRLAAGRLSRPRCERLAQEIQSVLAQAIEAGGSSLKDFRHADGSQGHFQLMTQVYGREGQPCHQCGQPVLRLMQGQRATYWCRRCQRR